MTATTDTATATTELPAWLNLDGFCPPGVRAQIVEAESALKQFLADGAFESLCRRSWEAHAAYEHATYHAGADLDGARELLNAATGFTALHELAARMGSLAGVAYGENPYLGEEPAWFRPWAELDVDLEEVRS